MKVETTIEDVLTFPQIKERSIRSLKWTALTEIVSRSFQPIITLVLARLLTPNDFGIIGMAMIVASLAQIVQDFGLGKTLIQRETEVYKSTNIILWTNIALSLFLYLVLFVTAPLLSCFFQEPEAIDVVRVLFLQILLFSLISVHQALLQRGFRFKQIFIIRTSSASGFGVVSIPLALLGWGVWSLVWGILCSTAIQVLLFWKLSAWRPKLTYDFHLARQLLRFSTWVTLELLTVWALTWGDSIILGHFLGLAQLGVYRIGITFLLLVFGFFFNPIIPVVYSSFSRLQSNTDQLNQYYLRLTRIIATISLPMGVCLSFSSQTISSLIFHGTWEGIDIVIGTLALKDGLTLLACMNPELLRASGKPNIYPKIWAVLFLFFIPTYIFAAPHGLKIFCISRFAVSIVGLIIQTFVTTRVLRIPMKSYLLNIKNPFLLTTFLTFVLFLIVKLSNFFLFSKYLGSFIFVPFGIFTYLVLLRFSDRLFFDETINLIKRTI